MQRAEELLAAPELLCAGCLLCAGPVSRLGSFEPGDKTGLQLSPYLAPSTKITKTFQNNPIVIADLSRTESRFLDRPALYTTT